MPVPCPRCTGLGDAHYLTCLTLRLPRNPTLPLLPTWKRLLTIRLLAAEEADVPP